MSPSPASPVLVTVNCTSPVVTHSPSTTTLDLSQVSVGVVVGVWVGVIVGVSVLVGVNVGVLLGLKEHDPVEDRVTEDKNSVRYVTVMVAYPAPSIYKLPPAAKFTGPL